MSDTMIIKSIKLLKNKTERIWIEENKHINILNYIYYRYLTNSYRDFLLHNFNFDDYKPSHIWD